MKPSLRSYQLSNIKTQFCARKGFYYILTDSPRSCFLRVKVQVNLVRHIYFDTRNPFLKGYMTICFIHMLYSVLQLICLDRDEI